MQADPRIILELQAAAGFLSSLTEQYRVDAKQLGRLGLGWLKDEVKGWRDSAEKHLGKVLQRIECYDAVAKYSIEPPVGGGSLDTLLGRELAKATLVFTNLCVFRKRAWDIRADGTTDIYEHAVQEIECQIFDIEQQQRLIQQLTPAGYVGARLEDE